MEYNPEYKRMYNRYLSAFSTNINKAREQLNSISVPNDFPKKNDIDGIKRRLKEVDILKVQREIDIICANIEKSERDAINAKFASMDINAPSMALNPLNRNTNGKNNELNPHSLIAIFNSQQNKNRLGEQGGLWENTKAFLANSMEISYEAQQLQTQANIEMAQKTGADIINTATALFWGIISGGEKIVDAFAAFGTNFIIEQTQNELRDMEEDGHKDDEFREKTEKELETLRVNTMAYVAEEKTNNYFENEIYDSTFMQNVNETAHNPFKKEGVAFELTKGVGEAIPIITAGVVSGGKAWAIAATSAVIGFGNASQENLQRAKENTIQGLEEKVKTGEMSQEEYDEIIRIHEMTSEEIDRRIETERIDINTIRAFSDEDLENIYLAGGISTEIYEQYKNIRQLTDEEINERLEETREYYNNIANISDNWQTEDVWNNTLAYSSIAALWEGAQGYAGSVLNTNPLGMSQLAASVVNVTIDSTTSFLDTIVRAGARSLVEGSSFTENFEELGGLTQAFINAGTGGTTSFIFGELPDLIGAKAEGTLFMNKAEATSFRIGKLEESLGDDAEKIIVNAVIDGDIEKLNVDKSLTKNLSIENLTEYADRLGYDSGYIDYIRQAKMSIDNGDYSFIKNGVFQGDNDYLNNFYLNKFLHDENIDPTYISLVNSAKNKKVSVETPKIDWASKMAEANYHTRKGHFIGIPIQDVNEIPIEFFEGIEDPRNVFFTQNGKKISFLKAKYSVLNMNQLKKDILLKVCDIDEQALKAKATYEELNKSVHYDFRYNIGDDEIKQMMIKQTKNFDNLDENMVICKGWAELYAEILNEQGIKAKIVKDTKGNHWWVEIELDNGRTIVADATEVMTVPGKRRSVDIANCKTGAQTYGFFYITSNQKGVRPSSIAKTSEMMEEIKKMDIQLGYADEYGYPMDKLTLIEDNFPSKLYNLIFNKNNKEKITIDILSQMEIPDNLDGYDLFVRYRLLNEGNKFPSEINPCLLFRGSESVCYLNVWDTQNRQEYIEIYSKSLGKNIFYTLDEANKFIKEMGITNN